MTNAIERTKIQYHYCQKWDGFGFPSRFSLVWFFFFNAYYLFDVGQNFWAFTDDVRRGSRKVVLCLSCLHSRDDRTTSSEISLLPWNFPLPELDPKSRLLMNLQNVSWNSFWKVKWNTTLWVVLAENFREERNIPSLGPGSLSGGGGGVGRGGGKGKNRDKQDKYRWAKRSQRLSGVSLLRSPIFFPFSPNAEPGPRLKHPKR